MRDSNDPALESNAGKGALKLATPKNDVTTAHGDIDDDAGQLAPWTMVLIFLFFYTISFIDRTIPAMMVQPLQADLHLSDFQISLLLGPAFGIFYVVCGLPMGWLVDRYSRRWIMIAGLTVWGTATAFCGFAGNYPQLFLGRTGVGVGESALTPSAHAMIAEQFPRKSLSTALSVFTLGSAVGGGIAMAVGGLAVYFAANSGIISLPVIGVVRGWQLIFMGLGGFTIITTPLGFFIGRNSSKATTQNAAPTSPLRGIGHLVRAHWLLFIGAPVGYAFINAITNAYAAWVPTFMVREYGWNLAQVGLALGAQHTVSGGIGFVAGAVVVDKLYARGMVDAHTLYPIVGLLVSVPLAALGFNCGNPWLFLTLNSVFYLLSYGWIGYAAASLQLFAPGHLRGQISVILIALATIIGTGLGAPLTGWLTDNVFGGKAGIGLSLTTVTLIFAPCSILILAAVRQKMRRMHVEFDRSPMNFG